MGAPLIGLIALLCLTCLPQGELSPVPGTLEELEAQVIPGNATISTNSSTVTFPNGTKINLDGTNGTVISKI
jgi:hypothetical protein